MSDETLKAAERAAAKLGGIEEEARLAAERERSETPAMQHARLRAERAAAKAAEEEAAAKAIVDALSAAVEAELDLRAAGPGQSPEALSAREAVVRADPEHARCSRPPAVVDRIVATECADVPSRLKIAMDAVATLAALRCESAAARNVLDAGAARKIGLVVHVDPSRKGYWLRQDGGFLRARDELQVGSYAFGESGKPHKTENGAVLAIRTVDGMTRYYDSPTKAETAIPLAIRAYDLAHAEVSKIADEREAAEIRESGAAS